MTAVAGPECLELRLKRRMMHRLVLSAVCLGASAMLAGAGAEDSARETTLRNELGLVKEQIVRSTRTQAALERELSAMRDESAELSAKLVELAAKIQRREALSNRSEDRLDRLAHEEMAMRKMLAGQRQSLTALLAGLQILERNPPPPIVTKPRDTVAAVRGAMLFGTIVPELKRRTARLARDLARLDEVRARITHERGDLDKTLTELRASQTEMRTLGERKQKLIAATSEKLEDAKKRAKALASKSRSLSQLMAAVIRQRKQLAERNARQAAREAELLKHEKRRLAATRKAPPLKFSKARGRIAFPAAGTRIRAFGDADGFGGHTKGIFIATRKLAQVTAPADGKVEFAGNFRSYGELLILDVGEGYHVLVAGMGEISVQPGQFVRAGEPVGLMGRQPARATLIGDTLETDKPILYVEFRRNGGSIDPAPWWTANRKEARR